MTLTAKDIHDALRAAGSDAWGGGSYIGAFDPRDPETTIDGNFDLEKVAIALNEKAIKGQA